MDPFFYSSLFVLASVEDANANDESANNQVFFEHGDGPRLSLRSGNFFWRPTRAEPKAPNFGNFIIRPTRRSDPGSSDDRAVRDIFLMRPMRRDADAYARAIKSAPKNPFWVRPTRSQL